LKLNNIKKIFCIIWPVLSFEEFLKGFLVVPPMMFLSFETFDYLSWHQFKNSTWIWFFFLCDHIRLLLKWNDSSFEYGNPHMFNGPIFQNHKCSVHNSHDRRDLIWDLIVCFSSNVGHLTYVCSRESIAIIAKFIKRFTTILLTFQKMWLCHPPKLHCHTSQTYKREPWLDVLVEIFHWLNVFKKYNLFQLNYWV
jgi:hypothetical protein